MKNTLVALLCLLLFAMESTNAASLEKPNNIDLVVAQDGSGDYSILQAALNAVPDNISRRFVIYIEICFNILNYFDSSLVLEYTNHIYGSDIVYSQSCESRSWGGGWI